MARNSASRLGLGEDKKQDTSPPPAATGNSEFQFVTPTEFVEIPTEGKYYPEGHPLHDQKTVEIRYMTAKEEDILSSATLIKNNMVIDRLLHSVFIDKKINPDLLFVGDKNALLIATRVTGYGPEYDTQVICPSCYSSTENAFDLNDINSRHLRSAYTKIVPNVDMKFGFDCPKCNHHSRVEVPLGPGFLWPAT